MHKHCQNMVNFFYWQVSEASETLSGVTQLKIGDICLYIYIYIYIYERTYVILYFDPHIFVFASWYTLPIPPLNSISRFSDPVSFKEIYLFTPLYWVVSKCHKVHLGLKNLLLHSTLCSNSLELVFQSQNVMAKGYYDIETLYQT